MIRITVTKEVKPNIWADFVFGVRPSGRISYPMKGTPAYENVRKYPREAKQAGEELDVLFNGLVVWESAPVEWA